MTSVTASAAPALSRQLAAGLPDRELAASKGGVWAPASAQAGPEPVIGREGVSGRDCIGHARRCADAGDLPGCLQWLKQACDASSAYGDWYQAAALLQKVIAAPGPWEMQRRATVWICGSYTTVQFAPLLALAGFRAGLRLDVIDGGYKQYRQEILDPGSPLYRADPGIVLLAVDAEEAQLPHVARDPAAAVEAELGRWMHLWDTLSRHSRARAVMHNFAIPARDVFGHLSAKLPGTRASMLAQLNLRLAGAGGDRVALVDCERLSADIGKSRWFDERYRHLSDQACALDALPALARNTAAVISAGFGLSKKCLVVDLDNTLWGGVVGEDGVDGIRIGPETPEGRSHAALQSVLKQLVDRGILLAVCSKNDADAARAPFLRRPEMLLRLDDVVAFRANWDSKPENIRRIAHDLGIGLDAMVFLDDNPAEREIVRQMVPEVEVLALPADPAGFAGALTASLMFETASLTEEDGARTDLYRSRSEAASAARGASSVEDFLRSLGMEATLEPITPASVDRVAQLLGKTNQFNLTGYRPHAEELTALTRDPRFVHVTLRLRDRFADHGLVGAIGGHCEAGRLRIDLLAMSCRVIGRTAEATLLSAMIDAARARGCDALHGIYIPTSRNGMVAQLYERFGFAPLPSRDGQRRDYLLALDRWTDPEHFIAVPLRDGADRKPKEAQHADR